MATFVDDSIEVQTRPVEMPNENDTGSIGWGILGFFVPLVGLILFLVWHQDKPKCAKMAGKGALISVIVSVVLTVLGTILMTVLFAGVMASTPAIVESGTVTIGM